MASPFAIEEAARRIDIYQWVEMRLFEVLGGWVKVVPELEVKMMLARHCYRHAWHAQLWHQVLPRLPHAEGQTAPASVHLEAFVGALGDAGGREATIEKLVAVYRVLLPHLVAAYHSHLGNTSRITDGPTIRTLGLVLADEKEDGREGRSLLESLINTEGQRRRTADRQAALEAIMQSAGGVTRRHVPLADGDPD